MNESDLAISVIFFAAVSWYLYRTFQQRRADKHDSDVVQLRQAHVQVERTADLLRRSSFKVNGDPLALLRAGLKTADAQSQAEPAVAGAAAERIRLAAEYMSAQLIVAGARLRGRAGGRSASNASAMERLHAGNGSFADVAQITADLTPPLRHDLRRVWDANHPGSSVFFVAEDTGSSASDE